MAPAMSNPSTIYCSQEEKEHDEIKEDRMSGLANDILVSILSLLGMKEATRTNILSRRWRYLSTDLTTLDFFDASGTMEKNKFLNWVNQVVSLHRASSIDDFRVCFPLSAAHANHINRWVEFAVSKRAKNLVLDFDIGVADGAYGSPYTLRLCANSINFPSFLYSLTSLCLRNVSISEELLELLTSRSHLLERLFVEESHDIVHLKVTNSSRLKYLAIRNCWKLTKLVVDAENLVSFEFESYHKQMDVVYHNVPSLVEAGFGGTYCQGLLPNFREISCFSAHLTKLSLDMDMIDKDMIIPSFGKVKHLVLKIRAKDLCGRLIALRCFPEACPLLREFKLQVSWHLIYKMESDSDIEEEYSLEDVQGWLEETKEEYGYSCTLPHLQRLECIGCFSGNNVVAELALALYIVKNANKLEKFICDPRHPLTAGTPFEFDDMERIEASREHARQLAMVIPSTIDLVIL